MSERSPAELILAHQKRIDEYNGDAPDGETALALLQAVYRNKQVPLPVRMRAASLAIPFEAPRLSAMAVTSMNANDFAAALDRAIARSNGKAPVLIEARAEPEAD
jgi:hypothetical protein